MRVFRDQPLQNKDQQALALKGIAVAALERTEARTLEERVLITSLVWDFVRSRDRIVYGGAALDALVKAREPRDTFYPDTTCDIEFYSHEPAKDVVDLCDLLHGRHGLDFVQGREAVHMGTLTVSVNFRRVCDITHLSEQTMGCMPFIRAPCGTRCTHPHVMAIDLLRMLSEPDTSYWRIEKAYARMGILEDHFPLVWGSHVTTAAELEQLEAGDWQEPKLEEKPEADWAVEVTRSLLDLLAGEGCVVVGSHAAAFFHARDGSSRSGVQLVSLSYDAHVHTAREFLLVTSFPASEIQAVKDSAAPCPRSAVNVREVSYEAFGDVLGRSTRFVDPYGRCLVEVLDAHPRCVPLSPVSRSTRGRVGASIYCLAVAMAYHLRAFLTGDTAALREQSLICTSLLASRQYTSEMSQCVSEDFGLEHVLGVTVTDMRLQALAHGHKQGRDIEETARPHNKRRPARARKERGVAPAAQVRNKDAASKAASRPRSWLRYNPSELLFDDRPRRRMLQCAFPTQTGKMLSVIPLVSTGTA